MPLITCPDCATQVSDAAPACPKCGRPMAKADQPEHEVLTASPAMFRQHPVGFVLCVILSPVGIGLVLLFCWWLSCKAQDLTVTSKRTIYRRGILAKSTSEVRHADVRNIVVTQSFLQRVFGVGTVAISSAGQADFEITISGIPDPQRVQAAIDQLRP
jgi:uncharacterized membrane protein YdbT with pleckstrin-like domain